MTKADGLHITSDIRNKTMGQLADNLKQFNNGTNEWHRWSALFQMTITDGVKYLADEGGAYWLLDLIASHAVKLNAYGHEFICANVTVTPDNKCKVIMEDGNDNVIGKQDVGYTDLEEGTYKLWITDGVILLPSEY